MNRHNKHLFLNYFIVDDLMFVRGSVFVNIRTRNNLVLKKENDETYSGLKK